MRDINDEHVGGGGPTTVASCGFKGHAIFLFSSLPILLIFIILYIISSRSLKYEYEYEYEYHKTITQDLLLLYVPDIRFCTRKRPVTFAC